VQVRRVELTNVRNVRRAVLALGPGLNVLVGGNAQGKTSVLEAMGLAARGLSFRSDDAAAVVSAGASEMNATAILSPGGPELAFSFGDRGRRFSMNGRPVRPGEYRGTMEVVVHWAQRLRLIRGSMRERREYLDRTLAAHRPTHARAVRDYGRVIEQRNALLGSGRKGLDAWDERLIAEGARVRVGRAGFVREINARLGHWRGPAGETFEIGLQSDSEDDGAQRADIERSLDQSRQRERQAGRTLVGPHRDGVLLRAGGRDVSESASSGQARMLLLSLALATQEIYRDARRSAVVGLLDDVDAELEIDRAREVCGQAARVGQVVVTTARTDWLDRMDVPHSVFTVQEGRVSEAEVRAGAV
jgi:DNA replication and repair protein RecF